MSVKTDLLNLLTSLPGLSTAAERATFVTRVDCDSLRIYLAWEGSIEVFCCGFVGQLSRRGKQAMLQFLSNLPNFGPAGGVDRRAQADRLAAEVEALDQAAWDREFGVPPVAPGSGPTAEQRARIHTALRNAYDRSALSAMLRTKLGKRLEDMTDVNQRFVAVLWEVIGRATEENWLANLLGAAADFRPGRQELMGLATEFRAELAAAVPPGNTSDPFRVCFLRRGYRFPFVNRDPLRGAVEAMHHSQGETRVLVVDGQAKTGKTYTNEYLTFLSSQFASHRFYYIDLAEDYLPDFRACDLMASIARRMGTDPDSVPPQEAQTARWVKLLVEWLMGEARKKQETWWVVIDHLCKVNLRDDMAELINRLVKEIDRSNPPLRLVLLDCGGPERLPLDALGSVAAVEVGRLSKPELIAFFRDLGTLEGTALDDDALNTAADWVLKQTALPDNDARQYMPRVCHAVAVARQRIFAPKEVPA